MYTYPYPRAVLAIQGSGTNINQSGFDPGSDSDRMMIIISAIEDANPGTITPTWGGVTPTLIGDGTTNASVDNIGGGSDSFLRAHYLTESEIAGAATQTLDLTTGNSCTSMSIAGFVLSGVHQSATPADVFPNVITWTTTISGALSPTEAGQGVFACSCHRGTGASTIGHASWAQPSEFPIGSTNEMFEGNTGHSFSGYYGYCHVEGLMIPDITITSPNRPCYLAFNIKQSGRHNCFDSRHRHTHFQNQRFNSGLTR